MDNPEFVNTVRDALGSRGLGKLFTPVRTPANAAEVNFTGFGIANVAAPFSTGWRFEMDANSNARNIQTFSAGTIYYVQDPLGQDARLILKSADVLGELVRRDTLPDWFPVPEYIVYRNVDPASIERQMKEYFSAHPEIRRLLLTLGRVPMIPLERAFLNGPAELAPVPVPAGLVLGDAAPAAPGRRMVQVSMQKHLDNAEGLFLDPAIYHLHWQEHFDDLGIHALRDRLRRPFGGPIANGVARYVAKNGGNHAPYATAADAAHSISDAVAAADPMDTVIILDAQTYDEGSEIDINKAITLTSLGQDDVTATGLPVFPSIDGDNDHRPVRVHDISEIVSLCNLTLTHGRPSNNSGPIPRGGGGLLIVKADRTYVRNCHVHHNETMPGSGSSGVGGGVLIKECSPYLYRSRVNDNTSRERGGGVGIEGGWPILEENLILNNRAQELVANSGSRPDGGGISVNTATPGEQAPDIVQQAQQRVIIFRRNRIADNRAGEDAGGLYLTALANAQFIDNEISGNSAGSGGGGGIHATWGGRITMRGDNIHDNQVNTTHTGYEGGGGISCRNVSLELIDVRIAANVANGVEGGGIYWLSGEEARVNVPFRGVLDFNLVLREDFKVTRLRLTIRGGQGRIQQNHANRFAAQPDEHRLGGGLYILRVVHGTFQALPFDLEIEDIALIANNVLDGQAAPPNSAQVHIEDQVQRPGNPITDANKADFVVGTTFTYHSP